MKKAKFLSVLAGLFILMSLNSKAVCIISCHADGSCFALTVEYDEDGNGYLIESYSCGGCALGPWAVVLDRAIATGSPSQPELAPSAYNNLAAMSAITPSGELLTSLTYDANHTSGYTHSWVNPIGLSTEAYNFIYAGAAHLDIFYVHHSVNVADGSSMLNLYSDNGRTVSVTYKNLTGTTLGAENVTISTGSNCKSLSFPSTLANGYYTMVVTTENGSVNTNLTISR